MRGASGGTKLHREEEEEEEEEDGDVTPVGDSGRRLMDDHATPGRDAVLALTDDLAIIRSVTPEGVLLSVAGELDLLTAPAFSARLDSEIAATDGAVVLDLSEVTFMSSVGIDALLKAREFVGPRLRIRAIHPSVRRVLELSSLLECFDIPSTDGDGPAADSREH